MQDAAAAVAAAATPRVVQDIQRALADESETRLYIRSDIDDYPPPALTIIDATHIIDCLQENPRFDTFSIYRYFLNNSDDTVAVLNVLRDGLLSCPSISCVDFFSTHLGNEDLDRLRPAFYNTSVTSVDLYRNNIQGRRGGEVLQELLRGNDTLRELILRGNPIGPEGTIGLGRGLLAHGNNNNNRLEILNLEYCRIGNEGLANFLLPSADDDTDGKKINNSLLELNLSGRGSSSNIEGAEGGRHVSLLLQRFPALKVLNLSFNPLGPLGARALAPGLAGASHLESLYLSYCGLGNDGVAYLVPHGQVNRSLTNLNIRDNSIQGTDGGESVVSLASRCTNLDSINVGGNTLSPDQQRRVDKLLDRKRLCIEAAALAGSNFSVLFQFMKKAHPVMNKALVLFL